MAAKALWWLSCRPRGSRGSNHIYADLSSLVCCACALGSGTYSTVRTAAGFTVTPPCASEMQSDNPVREIRVAEFTDMSAVRPSLEAAWTLWIYMTTRLGRIFNTIYRNVCKRVCNSYGCCYSGSCLHTIPKIALLRQCRLS